MLILQTPQNPSKVRDAIVDLMIHGVTDVRVASAYVTRPACETLMKSLKAQVGSDAFDGIPKLLVASFDYGITRPDALTYWSGLPNAEVLMAGSAQILRGSLKPQTAFHPKIYAFGRDENRSGLLIGSANMTGRGFSINTEAAWSSDRSRRSVDRAFDRLAGGAVPLTDDLLNRYEALLSRRRTAPDVAVEVEPVPVPPPVALEDLQLFIDAITAGLNVSRSRALWVQSDSLSGGSRNQLELPRGANRFFGFTFNNYQAAQEVIGTPRLKAGQQIWDNKPLSWHGNNGMERINLPTVRQGGFEYENTAIMFRRLPNRTYELIVEDWSSDASKAWRQASADSNKLYRLSRGGRYRLVGLL